jgi:hypothetical protein
MAKLAMGFGAALIALGVWGFAGASAEHASLTALIPAVVGGLLLACGLVALRERLRKHAMHAAAVIGLLGTVLAAGRGAMKIGPLLSGQAPLTRATVMVWLMAILCAVFLGLCIQSFIAARKRQAAARAEVTAERG